MKHRTLARAAAVIAAMVLTVLGAFAPATAWAADDTIETWDATYTVQPSGKVQVVEKLTYVFPRSNAQGITRGIVVREPWQEDGKQDRIYDVTVEGVEATGGASAQYEPIERDVEGSKSPGSDRELWLRVGTKGAYLPANTPITYTITYTVDGALINQGHGDELHWDVVPSGAPSVRTAKVTVVMPKGPWVETSCSAAATGGKGGCNDGPKTDTSVSWTASNVGGGRGVAIGAIAPSGTVAQTGPMLVKSAGAAKQQGMLVAGGATLATSIASALGGLLWWRRNGRDQRFEGLAPGIIPAPNEQVGIATDSKPQIPVQFSPPPITPGEAGLLADGVVDVRDTTSTLVDLAVRGVLGINSDRRTNTMRVQLRNTEIPIHPHEQVLLQEIFGMAPVGSEADLATRGTMVDAHAAVTQRLLTTVDEKGWYKKRPKGLGGFAGIAGMIPFMIGALFFFPGILGSLLSAGGMLLIALVPIAVVFVIIGMKRARGQRSAVGRAVTDQVEGFRLYLATAEAAQLKFEEGEDIFSKYLPWAIMFNLTDRWTKLCQQLVAMGRVPDYQPSWYYGSWYGFGSFDPGYIDSSLSTASTPLQADSGSGSGGSSFGGGGFSGGGGGGGSAGSW